jgi:hypothetical protein
MFIVPKGTAVFVVNFQRTLGVVTHTSADHVPLPKKAAFMLEDVLIDPLGHVGTGPEGKAIGNEWAAAGLYGFSLIVGPGADLGLKGEILLAPMDRVEVL